MIFNNLLFLFSGGQDSIFFLILYSFQEEKTFCQLLVINHEGQVNSTNLNISSLKLSFLHQQTVFTSVLKFLAFDNVFTNEKILRLARYQISFRIRTFYRLHSCLSGHTQTDRLETFVFNFSQGFLANPANLNFKKKKLAKKFYHQPVNSSSFCFFKSRSLDKKHKKKSNSTFSLKFSTNKRTFCFIRRPIKPFSRFALYKISKKISIPIFVDKTNFSSSISRNCIRRHILVYFNSFLLQRYNTQFSIVSAPEIHAYYFLILFSTVFSLDFKNQKTIGFLQKNIL